MIHAVKLRAGDFVTGIETGQGLACNRPILGVFQHDVFGRLDQGRRLCQLAIAQAAVAGFVCHNPFADRAVTLRHAPLFGGGRDQHHAGGRAAFADIVMAVADAAAAAGGKIPPDAIAFEILTGGGIFGAHFAPVTFEFFGDKLRKACQCALTHFHAGDADGDAFIRRNHHPGIEFGLGAVGLGGCEREAQLETACQSGGAGKKMASGEWQGCGHDVLTPFG